MRARRSAEPTVEPTAEPTVDEVVARPAGEVVARGLPARGVPAGEVVARGVPAGGVRARRERQVSDRQGELVREQEAAFVAWIASDEARAAARTDLRRRGLVADDATVDDVLGTVALRVLRRLRRRGPLAVHADGSDPVVAYARRAVTNAVVDLLRGPVVTPLDDGDQPARPPTGATGSPEALLDRLDGARLIDDLRRAVHLEMDERAPWAAAAALAFVTLATEPALPVDAAVPVPEDGKNAERAMWAGLHYAGRRDCFADREPAVVSTHDPAAAARLARACRTRRSRAAATVRRLLWRAWDQVTDRAGGRP